jgi:LysR family transcriptional regulator for metE and metH
VNIEIRHLRLVVAIVDTGTLARAARRLHLTPSALSHQLRDLETRLRTPLFRREDRRMVPTDAGASLLAVAQRVLADLDQMETAFRAGDHASAAGTIRLTTQCYTCYHWLPRMIADFSKEWPDVNILIVPEATRSPHEAVSDARVDVAIVYDHIDAGSLQYTPLFDDEMVAVMSPANPLARSPRLHPKELNGQHFILYDIAPSESYVLRHILGPEGVVPAKVSRMPLTEAIVELVRANLGVAILARWAVAPQIASGELAGIPLDTAHARRRWSAVRRIGGLHPRFENAFVALLSGALMDVRAGDKAQPLRLA